MEEVYINWNAISALSTIAIAVLGFIINNNLRKDAVKSEKFSVLVEYRQEIVEYSTKFFEITALAISEADKEPINRGEVSQIASKLSSIMDQGRFIFPNYKGDSNFGVNKGPAFQGFRREPLDAILASFFATESLKDSAESANLMRLSHRELIRANQPLSDEFDPTSAKSLIIEARRSYLNSVVPSTFPTEWRDQFSELYGPTETIDEQSIDREVARHLKARSNP